jgi:hypothetical protein
VSHFIHYYAERDYAGCHYAERDYVGCHYAECRFAECRGDVNTTPEVYACVACIK